MHWIFINIWGFFSSLLFLFCVARCCCCCCCVFACALQAFIHVHTNTYIVDHILHRNAKQETYSKCLNAADLSSTFYWPLKRYCTRIICFSCCFTIFLLLSFAYKILCVCVCVHSAIEYVYSWCFFYVYRRLSGSRSSCKKKKALVNRKCEVHNCISQPPHMGTRESERDKWREKRRRRRRSNFQVIFFPCCQIGLFERLCGCCFFFFFTFLDTSISWV